MSKKQKQKQNEKKFGESLAKKHNTSLNNFELLEQVDPKFFNEKKRNRLKDCFSLFDILNTTQKKGNNDILHKNIKAISYCKQSFCSCCNTKKGLKGFGKLKPILDNGKTDCGFITLTFPNVKYENFSSEVFKTCSNMFFHFRTRSSRKIREIFKNVVRKTETTINYKEYEYNLHYHLLVGYNLNEGEKFIIRYYGTKTFKKFFPDVEIKTKDNLLKVDFRKVKKDNISNELTGYVSKASIDSILKQDILENLFYKIKNTKRKDKKKYFEEQYKHIEKMDQIDISKIHCKGFLETKSKNFFNISGFQNEKKIDDALMRMHYNTFEFFSFETIENGEEKQEILNIVEYFKMLYERQIRYNFQRKKPLNKKEILELLFNRSPFFIPEEIKYIVEQVIK